MATTTSPEVEIDPLNPDVGDLDRAALDRLGIRYVFHDEFPLAELAYEATGLEGLRKEDERVLRLIYEANHGHGKPVATDDRVQQALVLVQNGYNVRAAATAVGIPEHRVRDEYDSARATTRLEQDLG